MRVQALVDLYDTSNTFRAKGSVFNYDGPLTDGVMVPVDEEPQPVLAPQVPVVPVLPAGVQWPAGMQPPTPNLLPQQTPGEPPPVVLPPNVQDAIANAQARQIAQEAAPDAEPVPEPMPSPLSPVASVQLPTTTDASSLLG